MMIMYMRRILDSNVWWQLDSDGDVVSSQLLKRLEWTYNPEVEEKRMTLKMKLLWRLRIGVLKTVCKKDSCAWFNLDSNPDSFFQSCR